MLKRTAIGLVLALLMALPATAQDFEKGLPATKSPFEKGVAAYIRKDFVKAAPQMHIAAENNTAWAYLAQFYLGSMCSTLSAVMGYLVLRAVANLAEKAREPARAFGSKPLRERISG